MSNFPPTSPFKLLQPYEKGDQDIYFGREEEIRLLTENLKRCKFILLYGASGTGKTSLIRCGLPGMFSPRDWLPIFIRRNDNFIDSIREALHEEYFKRFLLRYPGKPTALSSSLSIRQLIKALFSLAYVPVYLILDQFEEIFTLGKPSEQKAFFDELAALGLFEEDLFCKVILSTREEYIAHFYRYEAAMPFLFEHRFRIEKMRQKQLQEVVMGSLTSTYPGYPPFRFDENVSSLLLDNLSDNQDEVDLTTLQVYLDRLYHQDIKRIAGTPRDYILFDAPLIKANQLPNVLGDFLELQIQKVNQNVAKALGLSQAPLSALQVLYKMVTPQGTKQNRSAAEILSDLHRGRSTIDLPMLNLYLEHLAAEDIRVINRLNFAKSNEERFEIVHDRLAEQVYNKFNAEEIAQREAINIIVLKQKQSKKNKEFLSKGELELIDRSIAIANLEIHLQQFYQESKAYHKKLERRRYFIFAGVSISAIVFAIVAFVAVQQSNKANRALSQVVDGYIKDAEQKILILDYQAAWIRLQKAAALKVSAEKVSKAMLEPAFWFLEIGDHQKAAVILDSINLIKGSPRSPESYTNAIPALDAMQQHLLLRGAIIAFDDTLSYSYLMKRYYPRMIFVKGGAFLMGNPNGEADETSVHRVIVNDFFIAQTETTVWQYFLFQAATKQDSIFFDTAPDNASWEGNLPVVNTTWADAKAYCQWISDRQNTIVKQVLPQKLNSSNQPLGFRLPTEAEWEYAALGGEYGKNSPYTFSGSNDVYEVAWIPGNAGNKLHPVGTLKANQLNLFDMSGNCFEWCEDWYAATYYAKAITENPQGPSSGEYKVCKGSGFLTSSKEITRISNRFFLLPETIDEETGFRITAQKK